MASHSFQRKTKNGRPIIINSEPSYSLPVEMRIKNIQKELNKGLTKFNGVWDNIQRSVRALEPVV